MNKIKLIFTYCHETQLYMKSILEYEFLFLKAFLTLWFYTTMYLMRVMYPFG